MLAKRPKTELRYVTSVLPPSFGVIERKERTSCRRFLPPPRNTRGNMYGPTRSPSPVRQSVSHGVRAPLSSRFLPEDGRLRAHLPTTLALLAVMKVVSILVFSAGFLLTRVELDNRSACGDFQKPERVTTQKSDAGGFAGCWTRTPVDKVVILIIDGARFDFACPSTAYQHAHHRDKTEAQTPGLHSILEMLRRDGPQTSELFRFVADPPTTTQQRLKALLTGGLPTFVDVRKSFGASELQEDNVVFQAAAAGRRIALSGDDTWLELFSPAHFASGVEPFPSFNVKDLHTVDEGVRKHLMSHLNQPEDWDLLVGHFLGVDHAGHTFGVESPAMASKLDENDADVRAVSAMMASNESFDRAVLIVMGDHGMTIHGDHGGGTSDETDSFLFLQHPRAAARFAQLSNNSRLRDIGPTWSPDVNLQTMPQIDFAPSLSFVLGLPIPFGNLGTVPRRFFEVVHAEEIFDTESSMSRYADSHYVEVLRVTAAQVWRYLQKYISVAGNPFGFADWNNINELYKSATSDESLDVVTRIDRFALFLTTVAKFSREQWIQFSHEKIIAGLVCLTGSLMLHARMLYAHVRSNARARSPRTTCARQVDIMINHRGQLLRVLLTATLMTLEWVSRLSNSYIVAEGDSAHFLIASFAFLLLVCTVSGVGDERGGREFGSTRVSSAIFPAFGLLTCNMILHGLGISWVKDGSFDDGSNLGLEMAMHPSVRGFATPLLLVPLASLPWICTCTLSPARSTRGLRIAVAISLIAVGLRNLALGSGVDAFVRITGWDVEDTLSTFAAENLPWGTYFVSLVAAAKCFHLVFRSRSSGFRSGVTTFTHGMLWAAMPVIVMLSGARGALFCLLSITQMACVVFLLTNSNRPGIQHGVRDEFMLIWALHALSSQMFHAGGHRRAFDGLHFASAFTGFKKFNFFVMGILLAIDTWSGDILACAILPAASSAMIRRRGTPALDGGKRVMMTSESFVASLTRFSMGFSLLRSVGVLISTAFVAAERRHLMVWAIFAPKFAFETCGLCISEGLLLLGVCSTLLWKKLA